MNRHGTRRQGKAATDILTYNDLLFCLEYPKHRQNGTRAYMAVHPKADENTARREACRVLTKRSVQEQLARMYRAAIPDTIETIKQDLELAWSMAYAAKDYDAIDRISMDKAKLAGLLIDRQEIKTIDDASHSAIRSLVGDAVKPRAN